MRRFIAVAALLAFVVSAAAFAAGGKREEIGNKVRAELKKIDARLKLTSDQRTQIRGLLEQQSDKMDELYKEIEPREDAIRTEYRGKIREVLTPQQQAEWDKMKGEYRQKWNGKKPSEDHEKSEKSEKSGN